MADEKSPGPTATEDALWFFGVFAVLVVLWYLAGGPGKADLRGIFLAPPTPLGSGDAYGPTPGEESAETTATTTATLEAPAPLDASY